MTVTATGGSRPNRPRMADFCAIAWEFYSRVRRNPVEGTSVRLHAGSNAVGRSRRNTMRIARKLTLLAILALAATALAVPSAFGQETEPELHNQAPRLIAAQEVHAAADAACPAVVPTPPVAVSPTVTSGGCRLHVASVGGVALSAHLSAGGTEVVVQVCSIEFDIRIDAAAEGWISHQEFTGGAECTKRACGQVTPPTSEGRAYSFHMAEVEPPARTENAVILLCTENLDGTQPAHCEVTFPISQPTTHRYRFASSDASGHGAFFPHCELSATFDVEAALGMTGEAQTEQNVEIRHT